ncbi:cytochrome C, partial [Nitrosomonas sp. GH22]
ESAQAEHKKMETEGATCIDCHQNLVHEEAPMTDLNASLAAGKLVLKSEEGDVDVDDEDEEVEVEVEETETADDSDSASSSNHDDDSDDE